MMMVKMNASILYIIESVGSRNHHNTPFDININLKRLPYNRA